MSRSLKVLLSIVGALLLIVLGLFLTYRSFTRQALPKTTGELRVNGLSAPVEILRDSNGIPHIYAQNTADLFLAQGFVHAQERFWQMEFQRRIGAARLSEIFGEDTLETDIYLRQFGFYDLASRAYAMMSSEAQAVLDAYTAGVNAYIATRAPAQLGLEFALLGIQGTKWEIEPWTAVDSLVWGEMMIYDQADDASADIENLRRLATIGSVRDADFHPVYRADRPVIIPPDELTIQTQTGSLPGDPAIDLPLSSSEVDALFALLDKPTATSLRPPALLASTGIPGSAGSNSFVVSGNLTTTGAPLLANDPHMGVLMPAIWYQVGMHCVEKNADCPYNFRGYSLPGVPGILIGHNDRIAWGLTNSYFDAEDVFLERINPDNPDQYEVNGDWVDMDIRLEQIVVRGREEPITLRIRSTRNGLVVSDRMVSEQPFSYNNAGPDLYALSFNWTALQPIRSVEALVKVIGAQNWDQFNDALALFDAGKQNWIYADIDGNIGYVLPGKIPVRAKGDGTLPVPGWNDEYAWKGFIPYDQAPRVYNPAQGFIATANNPQVRADKYPYLLAIYHDRGQRAQRIVDLITEDQDGISPEDMKAIQTDNLSLSALEILPYLKNLRINDDALVAARDRLVAWDGQMTMDSPEAALFNLFWVQLVNLCYADQLPADLMPTGRSETSDMIAALLEKPTAGWWDDIGTGSITEDRDDILIRALSAGYADGKERLGTNLDFWKWGDLHTITFTNATLGRSGIGLIENIFNRGPFPVNGSESVVQKTCWDVDDPYSVTCIPAMRQVIDLGNLDNSFMVHSVGQSGHPFSPYYDNFIEAWRTFQYYPTLWSRSAVEETNPQQLTLRP